MAEPTGKKPAELKVPSLNCKLVDQPRPDQAKPKTVGDKMLLSCEGFLDEAVKPGEISFTDANDKYALHLLELKTSDTGGFTALVTSYKPADYKDKEVFYRYGDKTYQLTGLTWMYESVLTEAEKIQKETLEPPPEKVQPFPFMGPLSLNYPYWVWIILILMFVIPGALVGKVMKKRSQKKKLVRAALSGMGSPLSPVQDFSKVQRQIIRDLDAPTADDLAKSLDSLDRGFRGYLVRKCLVPAFDWTESEVIKDIRKHHPKAYVAAGGDVLRTLREFRLIKARQFQRQDLEQLLEQSRRTVEKLEAKL